MGLVCSLHAAPFIYASSAATYGDGSAGFDDDASLEALARLRPLNAYGWSKHFFDRRVARRIAAAEPAPPQWVGLKFFNVYGPNEYHKGPMQSVVAQKYPLVASGQPRDALHVRTTPITRTAGNCATSFSWMTAWT